MADGDAAAAAARPLLQSNPCRTEPSLNPGWTPLAGTNPQTLCTALNRTPPHHLAPLAAPPPRQSRHISSTQEGTATYWAKNGVELLQDGVTLDRLKAALVTVGDAWGSLTQGQLVSGGKAGPPRLVARGAERARVLVAMGRGGLRRAGAVRV